MSITIVAPAPMRMLRSTNSLELFIGFTNLGWGDNHQREVDAKNRFAFSGSNRGLEMPILFPIAARESNRSFGGQPSRSLRSPTGSTRATTIVRRYLRGMPGSAGGYFARCETRAAYDGV